MQSVLARSRRIFRSGRNSGILRRSALRLSCPRAAQRWMKAKAMSSKSLIHVFFWRQISVAMFPALRSLLTAAHHCCANMRYFLLLVFGFSALCIEKPNTNNNYAWRRSAADMQPRFEQEYAAWAVRDPAANHLTYSILKWHS